MQTDLLWVYEGLTSYLGDMLTARSGLYTPEQYRDALVMIAADLDHRSGRVRNPQDTADGVPSMQEASSAWTKLAATSRLLRGRCIELAMGRCADSPQRQEVD